MREMFGGSVPRRLRERIGRRRILLGVGWLGLGVLAAAACRDGQRGALTTLDATLFRGDGGEVLPGPGEPYAVRTELADAQTGREGRRRSLAVFHHLSDFRIVDEESPLRSEWVEVCPTPISKSAFRPQESLSLHAAAAMIAQANRVDRSPVTGRPVDFALHTGNAADNAQYNELRAFLDQMDGLLVSPDSGSPGYDGVQGESPEGAYGDLLEQAQREFIPAGLRYPWYAALGNRDVLVQGNFVPEDSTRGIVLGAEKLLVVGPDALEEVCSDPQDLLGPNTSEEILGDPDTIVGTVGADPARRILSRADWVSEHFKTADSPGPPGHGFSEDNRRSGTAYYTFAYGPVTFIVLDTVNPGGFSAGSIDAAQFAWLEEQLEALSATYIDAAGRAVTSAAADRLIVVVSHHGLDALTNPFPDPATQEERVRGQQLEDLLHRFPNVVLHVAGHQLQQRINARPDPARESGGLWEVTTASPLDYPAQSRLLEITDNADGTLAIFSTAYDSAAPAVPGDAVDPTEGDGVNEALLASLARKIAWRDPQLDPGAAGLEPSDRNAELILRAPFDLTAVEASAQRVRGAANHVSRRALLRSIFAPGLAR